MNNMIKLLGQIVEKNDNDPAAQRDIARMQRAEGGLLHQLSERSIQEHWAKVQAEGRKIAPVFAPPSAVARAEKAWRSASVAAEPQERVGHGR